MSAHLPIVLILAVLAVFIAMLTGSAAAQSGQATVNLNTYICPAGFDHIDNCQKIGGVTVRVEADGAPVTDAITQADSGVDVGVPVASQVTLSIVAGQPGDTILDEGALTFTTGEGVNGTTIIFLRGDATDPGTVDSDGDGLSDAQEAELGTDPANPDTDVDDVQDGGELNAGTDPLNPDTDGDGFTDREELDVQTDPLDPASYPVGAPVNSINLTAYMCPPGYEGKELFDACVEPAAGVDISVYIPGSEFGVTQAIDTSGSTTFTELGSGQFVVRVDLAGLDSDLQRYTAFCFGEPFFEGAPEPRQIAFTDIGDGQYALELTQNEVIHCTWFNIPADRAVAPIAPTQADSPVTVLPSIGTGDAADDETQPTMSLLIGSTALMMLAMCLMVRRRIA